MTCSRLRGYRDKRRDKFRNRLENDAIAFVGYLEDRHAKDLSPEGSDITGNLLDMQCSLLHELRRKIRSVDLNQVDYDAAGDVIYRVEQLRQYVEATAKTLQVLNLRLLAFGTVFKPDEAKAIVGELGVFLERFGRRFGVLREEIVADLQEISKGTYQPKWTACVERLKAEAARLTHITSVRVTDPLRILLDATLFYAPEGKFVSLMSRVSENGRQRAATLSEFKKAIGTLTGGRAYAHINEYADTVPPLFDYRKWFRFQLKVMVENEEGKVIDRKLKSMGSGGEQAVPN